MKRLVIFLCIINAVSVCAQTSYSRYDVNNDQEVNVTDVTMLVNIILGTDMGTRGDVNGDEAVDVNDVTTLVDFILGKRVINGHEFVDLGLPSGTLWATQNMGANAPEQAGDYYAWGELEPKESYTWATYTLCGGTSRTLTRYCSNATYGTVDNIGQLTLDDDAAYQQWGGLWRMPTKEQAEELKSQCKWTLNTARGGYVLTGPNGNTLFMPVGGYRKGDNVELQGSAGYYWTSTVSTNTPYNAYCMVYDQSAFQLYSLRYYGRSIRPVAK